MNSRLRDRIRAHACRWVALPEVTVPSAAISDEQTAEWSRDMYATDLDNEPEARTGEPHEVAS